MAQHVSGIFGKDVQGGKPRRKVVGYELAKDNATPAPLVGSCINTLLLGAEYGVSRTVSQAEIVNFNGIPRCTVTVTTTDNIRKYGLDINNPSKDIVLIFYLHPSDHFSVKELARYLAKVGEEE